MVEWGRNIMCKHTLPSLLVQNLGVSQQQIVAKLTPGASHCVLGINTRISSYLYLSSRLPCLDGSLQDRGSVFGKNQKDNSGTPRHETRRGVVPRIHHDQSTREWRQRAGGRGRIKRWRWSGEGVPLPLCQVAWCGTRWPEDCQRVVPRWG